MVIEDDPDTATLLGLLFKYENYQIITSSITSEEDLFDQIKQASSEVLLIDVTLKKIDGINLVKRVRSEIDGYHPLIIMTSGLDLSQRCLQAGADYFFQKPYDPDNLFNALSTLASNTIH